MVLGAADWSWYLVLFVVLLVSLTVHEAAHALFAKLGGDDTAHRGGQVTLNPLPHIRREPFGMIVMPLLSIYLTNGNGCMGFASAPIDPVWAYHHPKRAALVSAAGPLANALLAAIAFAVLYAVGRPTSNEGDAVRRIAGTFFYLNILLAVFNLFPVPPLDGAGVLGGLVRPARDLYGKLAAVPMLANALLLVVMFRGVYLVFDPVFTAIDRLLPYPWSR